MAVPIWNDKESRWTLRIQRDGIARKFDSHMLHQIESLEPSRFLGFFILPKVQQRYKPLPTRYQRRFYPAENCTKKSAKLCANAPYKDYCN